MTVYEFCIQKTRVHQLCVIRDEGWIVETVWIDSEDIFRISNRSKNAKVKETEFGELPIVTKDGIRVYVPCLYIDI